MVEAGTDVFRLNFSHASEGYKNEKSILSWADEAVPDTQAPKVAVLGDLQGPKARIGTLPQGLELSIGDTVLMQPATSAVDFIPVPKDTYAAVKKALDSCHGEATIVLGDGETLLAVKAVSEQAIETRVVAADGIKSRKGITVRGADIDLDPFSTKDQNDLRFCLQNGIDMIAVSFVRTAADVARVRDFIESESGSRDTLPIIAKIETLAATENIEAILDEVDGIMIARGDLGLQLGVEQVPTIQKRLARIAKGRGKPVIVATQMLESMVEHPFPTRAEATDVFNAILDGGDAVMLSAETSIGKRPTLAVETMDGIARRAESYQLDPEHLKHKRKTQRRIARANVDDPVVGRINEEIALTVVQFAEHIPARAIVSFTRTGGTPRRLSQYRPAVPLLAICNNDAVARQLLLHYGVHPIVLHQYGSDEPDFSVLVDAARNTLRAKYNLQPGDAIVVTAGVDWPSGGTNVLRVMVEELDTT
jgi:pyruvate kinase